MRDFTDIAEVKGIQSNLHVVFDTPQGKEVMKFLEEISGWYPTVFDSTETNAIIARDAMRRVVATVKTFLTVRPEQIVQLAEKE